MYNVQIVLRRRFPSAHITTIAPLKRRLLAILLEHSYIFLFNLLFLHSSVRKLLNVPHRARLPIQKRKKMRHTIYKK